MSWAKCARCGREFSCDTAFDRHQRPNYKDDVTPVICLDPAGTGLMLNGRGLWAHPPREDGWRGNAPSRLNSGPVSA